MNQKEIEDVANSMDEFERAKAYMSYYIRTFYLNSFLNEDFKHPIFFKTTDDFFRKDNVKIIDSGCNWRNKGFSERYIVVNSGAYREIEKGLL